MIKWWQWILIIIVGAGLFYLLYPKYYFGLNGAIRCNKITGKVERTYNKYHNDDLPVRLIK